MLLVQPVPVGWGCPGDNVGAAASAVECAKAVLASGTLVEGCGGLRVSSPRMPSIWGATDVATSGAVALSYPVLPEDSRYLEIGVEKADWTCATVPDTGSDNPVAEGAPTVNPSCCRLEVTWAMVARDGPNCRANCGGVRKCRYSGECGSDTACASEANAAGSRGLSVTVSGKDVEVGAGPTRVAPGGTRP